MTEKALPADIDAERATLGSVLLNRDAIIAVASWLLAGYFYLEKHAWIFEAMLACFGQRVPPDIRLVAAELRQQERLDQIGGIPYLAELVDSVPTSYHIEYYARIVERTALLRNGIQAGGRIAAIFYDESDADKAIADAYAVLGEATKRAADERALTPLSRTVDGRYAALNAAMERDEPVQFGVATGLVDYDDLTGGLHRSDLIILAARPGVGKSSLALCIARHIAEQQQRVDIFSLEMSCEQNLDRLIAMRTGLNLMGVRQLAVSERDLAAYMDALGWAHALPIAIDETPAATLNDIRTRVLRRAARLDGSPALIIVDYLGLMRVPKAKGRYEEVSEIARGLKNLAKELDVPVLALCQLSRAVEGRPSHVPLLSDLRESGEIEQAADQVAFIYREELYDRETDKKGIAELHIAKHRHGPLGVVPLRFDATTTRFENLERYRAPAGYADTFDPALTHFQEAA
jgi:replicative DNA helicase